MPARSPGIQDVADTPPRVFFIDFGIGFGGSIISLSELVAGLTGEGRVVPSVVTFQPEEFTEGRFPPGVARRMDRTFHYARKESLAKALSARWPRPVQRLTMALYMLVEFCAELVLAVRLAHAARRFGADLIHLNTGPERVGTLAARLLGVPAIAHVRGMLSPVTESEPRWLRRLDRHIHHYVAVSRAVAERLRDAGISGAKVSVVHNSVSPGQWGLGAEDTAANREHWGFAEGDVVAGVFGRVTRWKGQLDLVRAAGRIADACPSLKLIIVGDESDSDADYMQAVREAVRSGPMAERVVFAGYQHQVRPFYDLCDIVVHCSNRPEPFGRVVIEGMASHRATVAMAEGGPLDIVTDGVDGLLVPPRDPDALADALFKLCLDPDLRERLGAEGRRTVVERFGRAECSAKVREVYASVLSRTQRTGSHLTAIEVVSE